MRKQSSIKNRDIVVVGLQPWDTTIGSNCKDVALEFSRNNRVLYVNYPLDRITLFKNRKDAGVRKRLGVINGKDKGLIHLQKNLWNLFPNEIVESINWIKNEKIFNYLNRINNKRFARSILQAMNELGFRNIILFDDNDIIRSFYLKELLTPTTSIYYYRDFILGVDYWKVHGKKLEPLLIAKSDLCITNSVYFANYCRQFNPHTYYAGQGCDLEMFFEFKEMIVPPELSNLHKPIIGYVGALQSLRLGIDILAYIAEKRPDWSIVLVGPEDDVFINSELHYIENIYFTGARPTEELPAYIHAFDVCLNPQVINEVTIGNYPRKIDEYLAMGKPIVATKTELMTAVFNEHTYLGNTKEDYVKLIEQALQEDSPQKRHERKQYAATHTWKNHVDEIYKAIEIVESKAGKSV